MTVSSADAPPTQGSALVAVCGLCLLPLLMVADSLLAAAGGWRPRSAGTFGLLAYAAGAGVVLVAILARIVAPLRHTLRANVTGCLVFGVASVAAVVVAELALGTLWPQPAFHCRTANTRYVFEPYLFQLPGSSAISQVSFNAEGIRGPDMPPRDEAYRVLCLGGSTTECLYIDDSDCWTTQLAQALPAIDNKPVWVGAAAVGEYGTAEHLEFLRSSPLVEQVDCVVMLVGVNDLVRELLQLDVHGLLRPLWLRSNLIELVRYVWNGRLGAGYYYDHDGQKLRLRRLGREIAPFDVDARRMAHEYGQRIRALIEAARARDVRLVLVTQPVLWDDFLGAETLKRFWLTRTDPAPRAWAKLNAGFCRDCMDEYNEELIEVASEAQAEVIDAAPPLSGWGENFYDDYHLSRRGCRTLAEVVAGHFAPHSAPVNPSQPARDAHTTAADAAQESSP